jgi:hypothetical protein
VALDSLVQVEWTGHAPKGPIIGEIGLETKTFVRFETVNGQSCQRGNKWGFAALPLEWALARKNFQLGTAGRFCY